MQYKAKAKGISRFLVSSLRCERVKRHGLEGRKWWTFEVETFFKHEGEGVLGVPSERISDQIKHYDNLSCNSSSSFCAHFRSTFWQIFIWLLWSKLGSLLTPHDVEARFIAFDLNFALSFSLKLISFHLSTSQIEIFFCARGNRRASTTMSRKRICSFRVASFITTKYFRLNGNSQWENIKHDRSH